MIVIAMAAIAPRKAREIADRKVDMADNDDKGHAEGEDDDVPALVEEVGYVPRGKEQTFRRYGEKPHDHDQMLCTFHSRADFRGTFSADCWMSRRFLLPQ